MSDEPPRARAMECTVAEYAELERWCSSLHKSVTFVSFCPMAAIARRTFAAVILITDRFARAAALTPSICRARLAAKLTSLAWRNVLCSSRCAWYWGLSSKWTVMERVP